MNEKQTNQIIQTTQIILNISNKKYFQTSYVSPDDLKSIIDNLALGIKLNFQ